MSNFYESGQALKSTMDAFLDTLQLKSALKIVQYTQKASRKLVQEVQKSVPWVFIFVEFFVGVVG